MRYPPSSDGVMTRSPPKRMGNYELKKAPVRDS
ncbi:hypothetical protein PF005_g19675 [Phytophthora fragariae]|uniref:Uncharacterized protein n=1 Tax=Phytophthora fragariae TaxID=53985 RepID=A0A6A3E9T4_9STRA|nr:hypothetical protein PF003_g40303 [Phytophthora fragariae]KAE8929223.1 hypothetical protein PF009_g20654 [Phytophthora fragariae]KAE8982817.1 hypothetical protein PF011_g21456 [Phytophthora fragariae]KAE9082397.1 hypothetical protein PF010_g21601 [Phytophthora fragariae]KAE9089040.1 hypothetical protein PF007_g19745 [Phytophthora fragariae]